MDYDRNCVFCTFVNERTKDDQCLYEDRISYVMLDDRPLARGHSLVILKKHVLDITEVSLKDAKRLGRTTALISRALRKALDVEKVYVASLCEEVQHLHFHLIPRYADQKKGFGHFIGPRGRLENISDIVNPIREYLEILVER